MTDELKPKNYKPTSVELKTILEKHMHWLREDCDDWQNMKADLSYADLSSADLCYANLRFANLHSANLCSANLRSANLRSADLSYADLSYADLSYANLRFANLHYANLRSANGIPITCPSDGAFTAWKKAWHDDECVIVKLQIPEDAKRFSATGRKCRCDKAVVLGIYGLDGKEYDEARSNRKQDFVYKVGETVTPDSFDENRWNECSNGIHFFVTRTEAEEYIL